MKRFYLVAALMGTAFAQNTLYISGVQVPPGGSAEANVNFVVREAAVSGIQFDIEYDNTRIGIAGVAGAVAVSAGKSLYTGDLLPNQKRFLMIGMNRNPIRTGVLVVLTLTAKSGAATGSGNIQLTNVIAASPDGSEVLVTPGAPAVSIGTNPGPMIIPMGVVNAASFSPDAVVSGSVASIFGERLASGVQSATSVPLPLALGQTRVTINGILMPLFHAGADQINAQVPWEIPSGPAQVVVTVNGQSSLPASVMIAPAGPGILLNGNNRALALNPDGNLNGPLQPAKEGDTIVVYLLGGGPVEGSVPETGAPILEARRILLPFSCTVGGINAPADYLGVVPGSIGLFQANIRVPALTPGDHPIVITISGKASNTPLLAVR